MYVYTCILALRKPPPPACTSVSVLGYLAHKKTPTPLGPP